MCGIVGYLDKTGSNARTLGPIVLSMLNALGCRGPDSAGVALYGDNPDSQLVARVALSEQSDFGAAAAKVLAAAGKFAPVSDSSITDCYLRFHIAGTAAIQPLIDAVESVEPGTEVVSLGRHLEIVKQVGSPENLEATYHVSGFEGTHGIGHTRLSTESRVDLSHSQPFWGHGYPDLAIAHNGHITNYHQLRRRYEQRGIRFYTENDSEIIAIYLAQQLGAGQALEQVFDSMQRDLDGSFSCTVATDSQIGFVKDQFALKPLLFAETSDFVAIATEEIALRSALPGWYSVREAQAKESRTWRK
jgi:methylamine---glutamate N-methyltransferase subunit A